MWSARIVTNSYGGLVDFDGVPGKPVAGRHSNGCCIAGFAGRTHDVGEINDKIGWVNCIDYLAVLTAILANILAFFGFASHQMWWLILVLA